MAWPAPPSAKPGNASSLTLDTASLVFDLSGTALKSANLNGGDADPTRTDAGGNGGQLTAKTTGAITVNTPIMATTGLNSRTGTTGGNGGTVDFTSDSTITVNSSIETSSNDGNRRVSAKGGDIKLTSKATNGTAIQIGSTANLQALLSAAAVGPGGTVTIKSSGGVVNVLGTRPGRPRHGRHSEHGHRRQGQPDQQHPQRRHCEGEREGHQRRSYHRRGHDLCRYNDQSLRQRQQRHGPLHR